MKSCVRAVSGRRWKSARHLSRSRASSKIACTQQKMRRLISDVDVLGGNESDRSPRVCVPRRRDACKDYNDAF